MMMMAANKYMYCIPTLNRNDRLADASDKLEGFPPEMLAEVSRQNLHIVEDFSLLGKDDIDNWSFDIIPKVTVAQASLY